jgi:hypothetical protein
MLGGLPGAAAPLVETLQEPGRTGKAPAKTVIIVDAAVSTDPVSRAPYLSLIAEELKGITGASIIQESVTADWHREDAMVMLDPAVLIIHVNAFTLLTNDATGHTKFVQLLSRFRDRPTRFILYSRSTAFTGKRATDFVIENTAADTKIAPTRFIIFAPNQDRPNGVMRNDAAFRKLRSTVETLVDNQGVVK